MANQLNPNQKLNVKDQLQLASDRAVLVMQGDGNLALYKTGGPALWASNTWGKANVAIMQEDGNFVLYGANGHAYWSTNTWGKPGAYLVLQEDGNLARIRWMTQ